MLPACPPLSQSIPGESLICAEGLEAVFRCGPGQTILRAVNCEGERIATGCRGGGCGVCRIRILSGSARFGPMSSAHVSPEMRRDGWTLACRTIPLTDLVIVFDDASCVTNRGRE